MAFAELGMTEQEFFSTPPFRTYLRQMQYQREIDRRWEQTRFIAMFINNTAQGKKRTLRARDIIPLPFDRKRSQQHPEWTREEAEELINKWPDIPAAN